LTWTAHSHLDVAQADADRDNTMAKKRDQGAMLAAAFLGTVLAIPAALAQKPADPSANPAQRPSVKTSSDNLSGATQPDRFQSAGEGTTLSVLDSARNS
jgi:hypothetical protein